MDGDVDRIARFNGRFVTPVVPGGTVRVIVHGDEAALGWRLEDAASGQVCATGEAEIR
jgi:acyl dehydratase